ncbi:hypothetical protein C2E23DRAFT_911402 [Lenzites betulinus]|nr:hypothetical protein C2E23DRAFT_911402 [Lenzites betulinus]
MENLSPELLEPIFALACTDGGRTGCSLSRTSTYFRAVSRSVRFNSTALVSGSPQQVVQFLASFTKEQERATSLKPRVRHLCLASARQNGASARRRARNANGRGGTSWDSDTYDEDTEAQKQAQRWLRDVMFLMQMLAPDLETLCIVDPDEHGEDVLHLPVLRCAGFPRLVELAIIGQEPVVEPTSEACGPLFPRLRTFHRVILPRLLRFGHYTHIRDPMFKKWREDAPNLVDLNVANMHGMRFGSEMADVLRKVLKDRRVQLSPTMTDLVTSSWLRRRRPLSVSSN